MAKKQTASKKQEVTEPRKPPNAGKGRPPGAKNKLTKDVKAMILGALAAKGGQKYLEQQAGENPVAFMGLVGKVLPKEITGANGLPLVPATPPATIVIAGVSPKK